MSSRDRSLSVRLSVCLCLCCLHLLAGVKDKHLAFMQGAVDPSSGLLAYVTGNLPVREEIFLASFFLL